MPMVFFSWLQPSFITAEAFSGIWPYMNLPMASQSSSMNTVDTIHIIVLTSLPGTDTAKLPTNATAFVESVFMLASNAAST